MIEIKINDEYANLVYPLSDKEYLELKKSIKENGLWHPISINKKGVMLDGHNRYKICEELDIDPITEIQDFGDGIDGKLQEKLFVIDSNLTRRQLSVFARIEMALTKKPILKQLAKLNMSLAGKGVRIQTPLGRIDQKIAESAQSSKGQVRNVQALLKSANPEVLDKLRQGKAKISAELFRLDKAKIRQERLEIAKQSVAKNKNKDENSNFQIWHGDMLELGKQIADNSVDLIFTDPPYGKKDLYLYKELAIFSQRVLKPGGSLVFFMGHFHEDEIKDHVRNNSDLVWNHRFIVIHSGHIKALESQRIWAYYKPLLHYYKLKENGKRPMALYDISDVIYSQAVEKNDHDWEQSPVEPEHMIEHFTVENELVVDPFTGSGTTGVAAKKLNRRFIGIDNDKNNCITAEAKLINQLSSSSNSKTTCSST